jgi:Tfp pilus assembly protein PilF
MDWLIYRESARAALGDVAAAMDNLTEAIITEPDNADIYVARAWEYGAMGLDEKAGIDIEKAISLGADRDELTIQYTLFQIMQGSE